MDWLIISLLAPAIYAVTNFIDKYNLEKEIKDYSAIPIFISIVAFFVGWLFWIVTGFPILDFKNMLLVMLSGMFTIWGTVLYFKAISLEDVSKVSFYYEIQPVLILIMSFIILKESISANQLIGFALVLLSILGVSINFNKNIFKISPALKYVFISDWVWVFGTIMTKSAIESTSFSQIISYESWGIAIGGLVLFLFLSKIREAFLRSLKVVRKRAITLIFVNEIIFASLYFSLHL